MSRFCRTWKGIDLFTSSLPRFVVLAASCLCAAVLTSACGGGGGDSSAQASATNATTPPSANAETGAQLQQPPQQQAASPYGQNGADYELTFADEFDGELNTQVWNDHIWYEASNATKNYAVDNGALKIWPQRDASGNFFNRTIDTDGKYYQTYGYFEIEAKLPRGKGTWPAFWLFNHIGERRPEMDVMEAYAGGEGWGYTDADGVSRPTVYGVTVWQGASSDNNQQLGFRMFDAQTDLSAGFHKYAVKWEPNRQTYYFDGQEVLVANASMGDPMYLMLDLWFGSASGTPDHTTPLGPGNAFEINYVRAWQFKPPASTPAPGSELAARYVATNWPALKESLTRSTGRNLSIYDLQISVQPFVEWIVEHARRDLAGEVMAVYDLARAGLTTETSITVYGGVDGIQTAYATIPVAQPFQAWVAPNAPRTETLLNSSQFLFGVGRLLPLLDADDPRLATWLALLKSHYLRWIRGVEDDPAKGYFQVLGWGCAPGRYSHIEHVKNLRQKAYGNRFSYCNAVTDIDLWIIGGAAQLYQLHVQRPQLRLLSADEAALLRDYLQRGADLVASRLSATTVDVDGTRDTGLMFDAGAWRDHPDYNHAGYDGLAFPTQAPVKGPAGIGQDLSHLRRLIPVLEVLSAAKAVTGATFPTADDLRRIALQLTYGVFNRDLAHPLFTNYADGTNGWFRVNYNGPGSGYQPWAMSAQWLGGGYCQLAKYEPRARSICAAVLARVEGTSDSDRSYRRKLSECRTVNQAVTFCPEIGSNQVNFYTLNFLTSFR
jgi:beta-glucanase (GH16 family)